MWENYIFVEDENFFFLIRKLISISFFGENYLDLKKKLKCVTSQENNS